MSLMQSMPTNQHLRHKRLLDTEIETLVSGRLPSHASLFNISSNSLGLTSLVWLGSPPANTRIGELNNFFFFLFFLSA